MKITPKITVIPLLAICSLYNPAHADGINQSTAARFVTTFYQAVQKHNLTTVSSMIDDHAVIKILWTQADPPQTFTLSKADYLQQLKATWHFASNETYEIKDLTANTINGMTVVTLQENENRLLFGNKAGQHNELKISVSGDNDMPRITAMSSKTALW